jgi:hypothetical protein
MLYPLSYEGLRCTFAQVAGEFGSVGLGLAPLLPTVPAAPVPRAVGQLLPQHAAPIVRLVAPGRGLEVAEQHGKALEAGAAGRGDIRSAGVVAVVSGTSLYVGSVAWTITGRGGRGEPGG